MVMIVVGVLACVGGCEKVIDEFVYPSLGNAKRMAQRELDAIGEQTLALSEQHKLMEPSVADPIDELKNAFDARIAQFRDETEKERNLVAVIGERGAQLALKLNDFPEYTEIEDRLTEVDESHEDVSDKVEALRDDTRDLDQRTGLIAKDVETIDEVLQRLDRETVAKLSSVNAQTLRELERLKGDGLAFREKLAGDLQLTREAMDAMKGLTTEEILALVAGTLSAAAAGGALGKTGKSRGSSEIEKIKDRLDAITTDIAMVKPSSIGAALVAHGPKSA
jgi:archaellum component FlaC